MTEAPGNSTARSWWLSIPGILTALTATVTAAGGLLTAVRGFGWPGQTPPPPAAGVSAPEAVLAKASLCEQLEAQKFRKLAQAIASHWQDGRLCFELSPSSVYRDDHDGHYRCILASAGDRKSSTEQFACWARELSLVAHPDSPPSSEGGAMEQSWSVAGLPLAINLTLQPSEEGPELELRFERAQP